MINRIRAARAYKNTPPWEAGELPRMLAEVKALSKRDRREWWAEQRKAARRLLKRAES